MNITRTVSADCVALLTFDRPGSAANIFDGETLAELSAHISAIESDPTIRGVIVATAKPRIFIAGADLNSFAKKTDPHALAEMVTSGQTIFARLGELRVPTVAAIHGTCLGGGLELALACDWRIASTDKATKLGLPETQLGILPAWGGSTRLPRLIGLPAALGLILTGKQLAAAQALKAGIVDDVTHSEYLLDGARKLIARGKRTLKAPGFTSRAPLSSFVASKARRDVLAKTRGLYPAPLKAIEVCTRAVNGALEDGFAAEKAGFLELVRTPECRSLMSVFFLQERAKKLVVPEAQGAAIPVKRVAVLGAGTMGAGIAQWVSARGYRVRLKDVSPEALARGMHAIEKVYAESVKRRVFTLPEATAGLDRITPVHTDVPLGDVDLVIEAAIEKLDLKQQVFRELEARVGPNTVLATNTSALSIDQIASVLTRPERLVGLHFFNPVHRMQLVEIVRGPRTSLQAIDTALQFVKALGKLPVVAKDSPGFLVNRILLPYMVEAVRIFSEGVPAEEIDRVMLNFGMPMGPLRLCDEVGLDVAQHVAKDLERRLPQPIPITNTLERMVAKGWLGKKNGRGFYLHEKKQEHAAPNPENSALQPEKPRVINVSLLLDRMVLIMINEAARVLAEGVVESPEDVDFGMIMGTGWAPFRGGPLRHADTIGSAEIVRRLEVLARDVAGHFLPCERLREMAREGRGFYPAQLAAQPNPGAPSTPTILEPPGVRGNIDRPLTATPPAQPQRPTAAAKTSP